MFVFFFPRGKLGTRFIPVISPYLFHSSHPHKPTELEQCSQSTFVSDRLPSIWLRLSLDHPQTLPSARPFGCANRPSPPAVLSHPSLPLRPALAPARREAHSGRINTDALLPSSPLSRSPGSPHLRSVSADGPGVAAVWITHLQSLRETSWSENNFRTCWLFSS